jgi:hypothetical protein
MADSSDGGAKFHLNEVKNDDSRSLNTGRSGKISTAPLSFRQRTYIEGDWLKSYPDPSDESAILKSRLQSQIYSNRNGHSKMGVAQCLRCQKLFKPKDENEIDHFLFKVWELLINKLALIKHGGHVHSLLNLVLFGIVLNTFSQSLIFFK